jgi:hypothetical protein
MKNRQRFFFEDFIDKKFIYLFIFLDEKINF